MRSKMIDVASDRSSERGVALIVVLLIMMLMSALMIGFSTIVSSDQKFRGIDKERTRAYYGATSGLEKLTADLGNLFLTNVAPTAAQISNLANLKPTIPNVTFTAPSGVTAYGVTPVACNQAGALSCNGQVTTGPYQGLIALKSLYRLDVVAKTTNSGEVHLTRSLETVAIPVFQFGMFSDVDLSFFAGNAFNFGGRVHTNGNLFLTAQDTYTTTLSDKVTAVGDVIRARLQNGQSITTSGFNGTVKMATAPNAYRNLLITEGSLNDGVGSSVNTNWPTISLSTYNGYIRNGGCPPVTGCSTPPRGTGAKPLNLPLITVGGSNPDLSKRPPANENSTNPVLFGERLFGKVSLRILLSDKATDITSLPTVTSTAPVRLGDEGTSGAGLSNDWTTNQPAGITAAGTAITGGTMPPIARSPGQQTITTTANTNAGDSAINVTNSQLVGVYNSPTNLQFNVYQSNGTTLIQTVNCLSVSATSTTQIKFASCLKTPSGNMATVSAGSKITITDQNGNTLPAFVTTGTANSTTNSTTVQNYTVTSTASNNALVTNTFWMQSTTDSSWSVVTCSGVSTTNNVAPGPYTVTQLSSCSGVPKTTAGANVITTAALTAKDVGTIGGYIKIEIQKADQTWQDVTAEILNWGFADKNQDGTICADPTPNAIIRLQRLRDNNNACTYANSTSSYDYWPNTLFDTRDGILREPAPANLDVPLGGVMHYITLDVTNLSKWFQNQAPYGAGSGNQVLTSNGYSVYFSDRRNNRSDGQNNTCPNGLATPCETGEYGFEDIVNPLSATGVPNGTLDTGEDFNGNGTLETYGQYASFLGALNTLPPLPPSGLPTAFTNFGVNFNAANTIKPTTTVGRAGAMSNRAYLFRRALKLVNGQLGNIAMPGLTIVAENPVYIQGDWNWNSTAALTDPHSETSVIADAVTLLSSNWTDSNVFQNPYDATKRVRGTNWYRLAIIGGKNIAFPWPSAGNPDQTFGTDGGAHNFLRYLETGTSTVNFRGSIATFYYSRQANGTYKFTTTATNTVYSAPTRAYNFDTDFLDPSKLPPLTPVFRDVNMLGFSQETRPGR